MDTNNKIREDINVEKTIKYHGTTYKYYLYDVLVAQIGNHTIINKLSRIPTNHIIDFSTINFQGNPNTVEEQNDLSDFMGTQKEYKKSRIILDEKLGKTTIPHLGSIVFEDTIADIRLKGNKDIELYTAETSRGFYLKICDRLKEKKLINKFNLTKKGELTIELTTR